MTFKEKIDTILENRQLQINSVTALEDKVGAGRGAINDFYNRDEEPGRKTLKRILSLPGLNKDWWTTGKGEVFIAGSKEKHTPVQNEAAVAENALGGDPVQLMKALFDLEKVGEYRFIPKSVLEGDYRLSLKSERDQTIEALNRLIKNLEGEVSEKAQEIAELKSRIATLTAPQVTK